MCRSSHAAAEPAPRNCASPRSRRTREAMIEAVKFWNEPNNKSHWDLELDPEWTHYAGMVKLACAAVEAESPGLTRVLGGISPIDPAFVRRLDGAGVLTLVDAVAVHGFPLDWNHWPIHEWPD